MVEKHVCICSPPPGVSTGDASIKYCRCNTTPNEKATMNTEVKVEISKSRQKKIDAVEYNAARSIRLKAQLVPAPAGTKLVKDHPYYSAKHAEMLVAQDKMAEDVKKFAVKGEEGSEAQKTINEIIEKTIALGRRKIENVYKKHYGRSKYVPH